MQQLWVDNQVRANYRYDFFERINWRQTQNMTPAGATHYNQDLNGQLIYEATDTGTPLREYIWIDDMPLAVFADLDTASPQLYYVHPDHLNRPLRMTDGTQAVAWDAVYRPFGEVHSISGSATLNLRFPGQYFLIESGLHYNWHRHYDPTLGRYTQPDPFADNQLTAAKPDAMYWRSDVPLPFQDGPSVHAYAKSSPTMEVDPEGLQSGGIVIPRPGIPFPYPKPFDEWNRRGTQGLWDFLVRLCGGLDRYFNKPPDDAKDPEGAKAPGKPGPEEGFVDPPGGERWVKNPNGPGYGWEDARGDVWVPTGKGGRAHGGSHWDVQTPGGGYVNVYPGGKRR